MAKIFFTSFIHAKAIGNMEMNTLLKKTDNTFIPEFMATTKLKATNPDIPETKFKNLFEKLTDTCSSLISKFTQFI